MLQMAPDYDNLTLMQKVEVFVKGPGSGRETAIRSLQAAGLEILGVRDVSPQAHNGVRQKKRRRV